MGGMTQIKEKVEDIVVLYSLSPIQAILSPAISIIIIAIAIAITIG